MWFAKRGLFLDEIRDMLWKKALSIGIGLLLVSMRERLFLRQCFKKELYKSRRRRPTIVKSRCYDMIRKVGRRPGVKKNRWLYRGLWACAHRTDVLAPQTPPPHRPQIPSLPHSPPSNMSILLYTQSSSHDIRPLSTLVHLSI